MAGEVTGSALTFDIGGNNPPGQSVNVPADAQAYAFFWHIFTFTTGLQLDTLSLAGLSATHLQRIPTNNGDDGCGVSAGLVPATGSQTLDWSWTAGHSIVGGPTVGVVWVKGIDTDDPYRDSDAAVFTPPGGARSLTLTTEPGDLVVGMVATINEDNNPNPNGDQTVLVSNHEYNFHKISLAYKVASGTSTLFRGSESAGDYLMLAAVVFRAASESGVEGAGSSTTGAATGDGGGSVEVSSEADVIAPAATVAGGGSVAIAAAGAAESPPTTGEGGGAVAIGAVGDVEAPPATGEGGATVAIAAAGDTVAPAATSEGGAESEEDDDRDAAGRTVMPSATGAGGGTVSVSGAGTSQMAIKGRFLGPQGGGAVAIGAVGDVEAPPATGVGGGTVVDSLLATGETVAPAVTGEGGGAVVVAGVGDVEAPPATGVGGGGVGVSASGASTSPATAATGGGGVIISAGADISAPAATSLGAGVIATGTPERPPLSRSVRVEPDLRRIIVASEVRRVVVKHESRRVAA